MCTLIVMRGIDPEYPLVLAANRDEKPARPTQNPTDLPGGVYAPLDLVHGGSWIGVNRRGLVAALTNRFLAPRFRGRRSRGRLITEALTRRRTAEAVAAIRAEPPGTYNGFQLFLDDGREAALVWSNAAEYIVEPLGAGSWIFTGDDDAPGYSERAALVREWMGPALRPDDLSWLKAMLSFHGPGPENGTCVHGAGVSMESIFSMVIRRPVGNASWQIAWRAGRPCETQAWTEESRPIERSDQ